MERPGSVGRGKSAGRWGSEVFLRPSGAADYCAGRKRRDHSPRVGRRWPADPNNAAYRGDTGFQLQRLRPDHRRAR
nr:hypothetical protein [Pseudomonas paraglycinae]